MEVIVTEGVGLEVYTGLEDLGVIRAGYERNVKTILRL